MSGYKNKLLPAAPQAPEPVAWRDAVGNLYPDKESVDKYLPRGRTVEGLYTAPPAASDADRLWIDRKLAERVMDSLGRFTSDEGWDMPDMNTADDFAYAMQQEGRSDGR